MYIALISFNRDVSTKQDHWRKVFTRKTGRTGCFSLVLRNRKGYLEEQAIIRDLMVIEIRLIQC